MSDIKELTDKIQTTWEAMRTKNEEIIAESKTARAEDKLTLERMSTALDEQKARLDDIGLKMERKDLVKPGEVAISEEAQASKAAFWKWVREGKAALEPTERKALVETTAGLYLVPEELEAEIMRAVPQINTLRGICRVRPTSRDKVSVRSLTELSVGWGKLETGTEITESSQTPTKDPIYVEDLYGLTKIGEDELQDTDANLMAILADSFAVAIANEENKRFAIGRGHTTYAEPGGVTLDSTLLTSLATGCGAGDDAAYGISWATDDTAIPDDMLKAEYKLPAQYLNGASWLMNRKTELELRLVKASTAGIYLWQPSLQVGQPNNFDGFPIYNQNDMHYPDAATYGVDVVFGNFKRGYMILDRAGIAIQRLDELYAEAGLVGFKVHKRVGGDVYRPAAFTIIVNDV